MLFDVSGYVMLMVIGTRVNVSVLDIDELVIAFIRIPNTEIDRLSIG